MLVIIAKGERLKTFQDVKSFWMKTDKKEVSLQRGESDTVYIYDLEGTDVKMWYGDTPEGNPAYHYPSLSEKVEE